MADSRAGPHDTEALDSRRAAAGFHFQFVRLGLLMQGHIYKANGGDILDILGFIGDLGAGGMYIVTLANELGTGCDRFRYRGLWDQVHDCRRDC
jgi:hypothetical protein